jgi:hypothetical protein
MSSGPIGKFISIPLMIAFERRIPAARSIPILALLRALVLRDRILEESDRPYLRLGWRERRDHGRQPSSDEPKYHSLPPGRGLELEVFIPSLTPNTDATFLGLFVLDFTRQPLE